MYPLKVIEQRVQTYYQINSRFSIYKYLNYFTCIFVFITSKCQRKRHIGMSTLHGGKSCNLFLPQRMLTCMHDSLDYCMEIGVRDSFVTVVLQLSCRVLDQKNSNILRCSTRLVSLLCFPSRDSKIAALHCLPFVQHMTYSFWETWYFLNASILVLACFPSLFPVRFHYIAWGKVSHFKLCVYWRVLDLAQQSGAALQHSTKCMPPPHSYVPLLFVVLKFNACWTTVFCMGRLKPMLQSTVELTSTSFSLGFLCFAPSKVLGWILYKYLNASHSRCAQAEAPCWYKWIGLFWTDLVLEIFHPSLIYNDVCSNSFKQEMSTLSLEEFLDSVKRIDYCLWSA